MGIAEAVKAVQKRINNSAVKAGRNPSDIRLVAVTKNVELARIIEAVKTGVTVFGENRVQEAQQKISNLKFQISNFFSLFFHCSLFTVHCLLLLPLLQKKQSMYLHGKTGSGLL